jgi:glycosyltransferase involved in cell wall biosynthesis
MRVSIMFRPQGEAPERAARLASALEERGHAVSLLEATSAPLAVRAVRRRSPEVVHAVGSGVAPTGWLAARAAGSALVCEALPGDAEPSGAAARAFREATSGRRGGTVLARDESQAELLRGALGLPYLPAEIGDLVEVQPRAMLIAVYDRLPELGAELAAEDGSAVTRARSWAGELAEPIRRGAIRRPGALFAYLKGRRLRARGQFPAAIEALTDAAARDDGDPVYELFAAKALREAGEPDRALDWLERLAADGDGDPEVLGEAAVELTRLGHPERARALADQLADDSTGKPPSAPALAEAARVHAALGDLGAARELATRAAAHAPDGSATLRTAALALEQAGEPSRALELARRAGERDQERRLQGLLRELGPGWRPALGSGVPHPTSDGSRVLALLEVSLPHAPSGYAYRSRDLLAALRGAGFDPFAATRLGFPASRGVLRWSPVEDVDGVVHHRFNVPGMRQYSGVPLDDRVQENAERVLDLVRRTAPRAIVAGTPDLNGLVALGVGSATGVPIVYDVRGFPEMSWATRPGGSETELYRLRREAETACAAAADAVITLSETMRNELTGRGIEPERISVVPQIVDTERFSPRPGSEELARSYGLENRVVIGSVTSLTDYEGIDDLLRAVAHARSERPEIAVLIVGEGAYRPVLEELTRELDLAESVVFAGRIEQERVPDHYALLDLFAIPRRDLEVCRAVTPLKPFEALAMEIPVLASDVPALSEIIENSAGGRTVAPGSEAGLAESMLELCGDASARKQLGRSGREYVMANHTSEHAGEALRAALAPLVGEDDRDGP